MRPRSRRSWRPSSILIEDVTVEIGDTLNTPFGYGTYASRSAAVGAVAVYNSLQKIKAKARRIAAHMLEADVDDIALENGKAFVKGVPDNAKTIQEIAGAAALAYDLPENEEPFLDDTTYYDPPNCTSFERTSPSWTSTPRPAR